MGLIDTLLKSKKKESKEVEPLPVLPSEIYKESALELKDYIAPSALKIQSKSINLGDKVSRTYFITSYPRFLTDNWFSPIINLDKIFDVSIHIHPVDSAVVLKHFQKKVAEVQSQISTREEKGLVRDPILDTAYRDLENLRDQLQQAQEKMFEVGLYLTFYADSERELLDLENRVKSILEAKLVYMRPALFQQVDGFLSTMPIALDKLEVHQKLNSQPLSSLFPFVSFDLTDEKGIMYGVNRHNSSLVIFDRFSMPNYNSITFATSGAGKSFATKLEVLRSLMFDIDVMVLDPEREYEYLAESVGGRYFNISLSSEHHINPFDLPVPHDDETVADILRSNTIHLVGLFRIMLGGLTPEEDALIDQAITQTYALKDIGPETDLRDIVPPLLSDFEMVLQGMEGTDSILQRLSKFTKGSWSNFINKPTNVDINKKFIVFSVRDMEDDLKPAAMYIVMHYIWNAVRKELKKRILVVDEAWWMMKSDDTASFLYSIAKRGRKYFLGLATITQDVGDFMRSKYGVPIVTNSSIQLLLKQSPSTIDVLQKTFNLTEEEKYLLLEANVGEGIFFAGLKHVAIKIIPSYTEEQIITSDPSEILQIQREKQAFKEQEQASQVARKTKLEVALNQQKDLKKGTEEVARIMNEEAVPVGEKIPENIPQASEEKPVETKQKSPTQGWQATQEQETPQPHKLDEIRQKIDDEIASIEAELKNL